MDTAYTFFNIASLHLRDFKCFADFHIDFNLQSREIARLDEQGREQRVTVGPLTVLVAKNGMGKTAVLDALRILFGTYTSAFSSKSPVHAEAGQLRLWRNEQGELRQAASLSVQGKVLLSGVEHSVSRELSSAPRARTTVKEVRAITDFGRKLKERRAQDEQAHMLDATTPWPVLGFYGTGRLWLHTKETERKLLLLKQADFGYENCLGSDHNFKAMQGWLTKAVNQKIIEQQDRLIKSLNIFHQIAAITQALSVMLEPEGYLPELTIESVTESLAIKQQTDDGVIPVAIHQLSDGVRAAFGLVADIAFRCAKLNPYFCASAARETHGIVFIDEVDLHLHPAWQQKILNTLQLAFPNIQFIVTTHSPQVLSAIPKECVRSLDGGESAMPETETQGVESQDILAQIFATPPAPEDDEWTRKLHEYAAAEARGKADERQDLYNELRRHFGPNYPPLQRIEIHRRFTAAKEERHA